MYKLNDIFYQNEEYSERADFCNQNNQNNQNRFKIIEIGSDEKGRRFQIVEISKQTEEEELLDLRMKRNELCFSIINRGQLWYSTLTYEQLQELQEWYQKWLNVTETKNIPDKPYWLK